MEQSIIENIQLYKKCNYDELADYFNEVKGLYVNVMKHKWELMEMATASRDSKGVKKALRAIDALYKTYESLSDMNSFLLRHNYKPAFNYYAQFVVVQQQKIKLINL